MVADRLDDVLQAATVRFTHLMNTNDLFEVRRTFDKFAGPRFMEFMGAMLEEEMHSQKLDDRIAAHLQEIGLGVFPVHLAKEFFGKAYGRSLDDHLRQGDESLDRNARQPAK
ncbi:hypothetical protein [Rhizobium sp. CNPSo 3490]|uniref:hypothetical protein n=1 Tax=Rhizobium sp. CNPSo 3490 TaxID=3021407 RepID=UPI00254DE843|nr:hypothetical protein [Rhizobium sp. CNPSo 3490]MDK4736234.1 hypothetical protein [Rhizobium sp. CNPSo 3490]